MKQKNIIEGKPLNFNVGLQRCYTRELLKLVDDLTNDVLKELKPIYKENQEQIKFTADAGVERERNTTAQDASISSQMRIKINSLRDLFEKKFKDKGETI